LRIFNEVDSALKTGMEVWVKLENGQYSNHLIGLLEISGEKSLIKFSGCDRCEDAHQLSGLNFSIPRSSFAPLNDESLYLIDLIGCNVLDENRNNIGSVVDTMSLPAQNLIVVETSEKEVLIPFVDAHVSLFDKKKNILIVKDVEGLIS
jgi:16S rRNA processing protein RimM